MTSSDNGNKRKVAGGRDARTRTIPSLEIESVRNLYQRTIETGVRPKPGTVQLGPEMLQEHTDAAALVPAPHAEVESESAGGATVARESVLGASRLRREITPVPPDDGLARLIAALDQEILSDEPPPYLPARIAERFDGMMRGGTLEMKFDPAWLEHAEETGQEEGDAKVDLQQLTAKEGKQQVLPNAYALSDEAVCKAFVEVFGIKPAPEGEKLLAVGRLARLEARIVDHFATLGRAYRELVLQTSKSQYAAMRQPLDKLGLLSDRDLKEALRRWEVADKARKASPGRGDDPLKPVRMVGAYLVKKKGEMLCRLKLPRGSVPGSLVVLQREVRAVKQAFDARRQIIDAHFEGDRKVFATSFLVQRGLNARPGFFWSDETCLDL